MRKLFVRLSEENYAKLRLLSGLSPPAPAEPKERPGRPVLLELPPKDFDALLTLTLRAGRASGGMTHYRMTIAELIEGAPERALGPTTYTAVVAALIASAIQRQKLGR